MRLSCFSSSEHQNNKRLSLCGSRAISLARTCTATTSFRGSEFHGSFFCCFKKENRHALFNSIALRFL